MDGLLLGVGVGREVPVWLTVGLELIIIFGAALGHPNGEALGLWLLGMMDVNVTGSDATMCVRAVVFCVHHPRQSKRQRFAVG
jgi:hypothetical protein